MEDVSMTHQTGPFGALYEQFKAGRISRRDFLAGATKLGVAAPVTLFVMNATKVDVAHAQDAAPAERPAFNTENQTRGSGGELRMLQWQGVTHFGLHTATGTKDQLGASLVTEPLLSYLPDGTLSATLAAEVPSVENGGLAEDFSSVTYKLKEGVLWSDGTPFTADDVVFTWQWITNTENSAIDFTTYEIISAAEAIDPLTVKITFATPQRAWYLPFVGSYLGSIYPKHVLEAGPDAYAAFILNPVGTGPYIVESFQSNSQVVYAINQNYREPNKPFFERVNIIGQGDSTSAAQGVLETGDFDFAWNLQTETAILNALVENGIGTVQASPATNVERLLINFSDPDDESMGERSHKDVPHPIWSDIKCRQALSLATDRDTIATQFYLGGDAEPGAKNILTGLAAFESPNTSYEFNLEKAAALLDEAGWVLDGDVRKKDGREFAITYSTSINQVRQKTQAVNKQNLESIGIKVTLKQVDAGIFFDSAAGNEQNAQHFYEDLLMYTNGPSSIVPLSYMDSWYAGPDGSNISQKSNNWGSRNESRYANADYDAMFEECRNATDPEVQAGLFVQMNDHLINEVVIVPEVARAAEKYAIINTLNNDNIAATFLEALYWNIANWNRVV
jgi:peptide/nickel transport system substrate-binding protein